MAVIIKNENNEIFLLSKGSDAKMKNLLNLDESKYVKETYDEILIKFSENDGLRALVCAKRSFTNEEFEYWNKNVYLPALLSISDKENKIFNSFKIIMEGKLSIIGILLNLIIRYNWY
jgi:phospholipid-translocating ATPase